MKKKLQASNIHINEQEKELIDITKWAFCLQKEDRRDGHSKNTCDLQITDLRKNYGALNI